MQTTTSQINVTFGTLTQAYDWATNQIRDGLKVEMCRICQDRFPKCRPRGKNAHIFRLFGVTWKTEKVVREIEPNGQWRIEMVPPDTRYETYGILGNHERRTTFFRMSCWYSRFLPYAVAMMECENGFVQAGIDHNSINCYYNTVGGFWELGLGDGYIEPKNGQPEYYRIVKEDVDLFGEIYHASMRIKSPDLPFDESFRPCVCYVALHKPERVIEQFSPESYLFQHVREVCERINRPVPKGWPE